MTNDFESATTSRRRFLGGGAATAAALTFAATAVSACDSKRETTAPNGGGTAAGGGGTTTSSGTPLEKATLQGNEVIATPIGDITLVDNYFDAEASTRLYDEMDYQRATQSYLWSTPLVSVATWRDRRRRHTASPVKPTSSCCAR